MKRGNLVVILILLVFFISSCENQTIQFSTENYEIGDNIVFKIKESGADIADVMIHKLEEGEHSFLMGDAKEPTKISISKNGEISLKNTDERLADFKIDSDYGYIVEFKENPLVKAERSLASEQKNKILKEHSEFLGSLDSSTKVKREFYKGFNGVAIGQVSKEELEKIKLQPNVKKIWKDKRVTAFLDDSTGIISADQMWANGYTGEGVTIAIIDTGVDYTHSDLGGCLGEGCKVEGGYDFVNQDSNPMDDHGHGTHCAGIAASTDGHQEGLIGVAPGAKIYAYKVLNAEGSGSSSQVMAGIEAAMDPNGDDDFSDHVDVISMSLGAYCWGYTDDCGPNDPQSLLIDAATDIGITSAIAAGNDYSYGAIGSPGTARTAITVGASCKEYGDGGACKNEAPIAEFSSKGPVSFGQEVLPKPDVVAPGVNICASQWEDAWEDSQCADDEHTAISGTSMATPHVAGAIALLKESHSGWTPSEIKSALMLSANQLEFDSNSDYPGETPNIFFQGSGQIDVVKANNVSILTDKQYLSHGFGTGESETFIPVTIKNIGAQMIMISIEIESSKEFFEISEDGESNEYPIIHADQDYISLGPGEETSIGLEVNLDGLSGIFFGRINLNIGEEIQTIPYAFSKLSRVTAQIGDGANYGYPLSYFYAYPSTLDFGFGLGDGAVQTGYSYLPGNRQYILFAASDFDQESDYIIYDSFFLGEEDKVVDLMIGEADLFTIRGTSLQGEDLWLGNYIRDIYLTNGELFTGPSFSDPLIGDRHIYLSNKPEDFPAEVGIVFRTRGIENE
jgi:subtilisin family serine protease